MKMRARKAKRMIIWPFMGIGDAGHAGDARTRMTLGHGWGWRSVGHGINFEFPPSLPTLTLFAFGDGPWVCV